MISLTIRPKKGTLIWEPPHVDFTALNYFRRIKDLTVEEYMSCGPSHMQAPTAIPASKHQTTTEASVECIMPYITVSQLSFSTGAPKIGKGALVLDHPADNPTRFFQNARGSGYEATSSGGRGPWSLRCMQVASAGCFNSGPYLHVQRSSLLGMIYFLWV